MDKEVSLLLTEQDYLSADLSILESEVERGSPQ